MKLLIVQFSPISYYFILFGPNIFLSNLLSNTLSPCPSLSDIDQVSHSFKTTKEL
jgi:hypothetical protein